MEKRVAFIAHCFLNQNAKVSEFARCAGVVQPVVELLWKNRFIIEQLPCPEVSHAGVVRWWQSREMYDNTGYREHCRRLAMPVVAQIKDYLSEGYEIVLIGLDGSPSSGVRLTGSQQTWGGRPEGAEYGGSTRIPGRGVWIEVLDQCLSEVGIALPRATGLAMDDKTFVMKDGMHELEQFLNDGGVV